MKSAAIKLKDAEKLRIYLLKNGILNKNYKIERDKEYAYLPVNKEFKFKNVKFADKIFKKTKEDLKLSAHSYDCVGNIAIFNKEITKKEANEFIKFNRHIKTVLFKIGKYSGEYRIPELKFISGINTRETVHNENGIRLKLDVERCYSSVRTSNERLRIANLVKRNEIVLVMFSGVGPYTLLIAKKAKWVYGIELNKLAHKYAEENAKINKNYNVKLYCGDVRNIIPELKIKFDRVIMPSPTNADEFLGLARKYTKKNGIIHLYKFLEEKDVKDYNKIIKGKIKNFKILKFIKCGNYSPRINKYCFDIQVK